MILYNARFFIGRKQVSFARFMKAIIFNEMLEGKNEK